MTLVLPAPTRSPGAGAWLFWLFGFFVAFWLFGFEASIEASKNLLKEIKLKTFFFVFKLN